MSQQLNQFIMTSVIGPLAEALYPMMFLAFFLGIIARVLLYYTVKTEYKFAKEFEKRTLRYLADPASEKIPNFYKAVRVQLEKTYFESFELRKRYKRRNLDHIATIADRLFLMQDGAQRLVKDTVKQARYMRKDGPPPRMLDVTKGIFDMNPVFTKLLGFIPIGLCNEMLSVLPGLFVIAGILGNFLGVSAGLPALSGLDLSNMEQTKTTMDTFITHISFSMVVSVVGIAFSVVMTILNTMFAADGVYFNLVNTYAGTLETLWNETSINEVDREDIFRDENAHAKDKGRPRTPEQLRHTTSAIATKVTKEIEEPTRTFGGPTKPTGTSGSGSGTGGSPASGSQGNAA